MSGLQEPALISFDFVHKIGLVPAPGFHFRPGTSTDGFGLKTKKLNLTR